MRPIRFLPLMALALCSVAGAQGDCLDQTYIPNPATNGLEVTANQPCTQTFTCGLSGQLTRVEISLINHHRGTPTQPLEVDIVTTDANGVPTTNSLAHVTLQPSSVPPSRGAVEVDLSSFAIQVLAGQVLGLALATNAAPSGQTYAWWGEAPNSTYDGGSIFIRGTTKLDAWDLAFRTWVATAASAGNYGNGTAGTNGVPTLAASANPVLGTTIQLQVGNSLGAPTQAALAIGFQDLNLPFLGGVLLVLPTVAPAINVPTAGTQVPIGVPADPAACGAVVFVQALLLDGGAPQGVAFTPGLRLVLGR